MDKIKLALKSKTVWTVVIMVLINSIDANVAFIPANILPILNIILGLVAGYFKVTPSQNYPQA